MSVARVFGVFLLSYIFLFAPTEVDCSQKKVKLTEVKTLTLQRGHMTTGRRSSPVPQLSCIYGGTVDCTQLYLPTVQCYNRGSDGVDVQWECKADMDANYRFGHIQVVCEGYDYPDDPYVLAGSCGLEYYVNYAPDKTQAHGEGHHGHPHTAWQKGEGIGKSWILVLGAGIIVYAIYKTCIVGGRGMAHGADGRSRSNDDFPDDNSRRPPPPGFRPDYFGGDDSSTFSKRNTYGGSSSSSAHGSQGQGTQGAGLGGGGFWTGAATGGLLGYMFGARNNGGGTGYNTGGGGMGGGGGWFGGGGGTRTRTGSNWGEPQPSTSSGFTRTTSGFGGTRRR